MKNIWMIALVCLNILSTFGQQKIDLLGSFDRTQPIKLSEIAKSVRTIQLETTDDCLLVPEDMFIHYGQEYIFIFDGTEPGNFYRFDLNGKFINKIGNAGPGPKEYIKAYVFKVDEIKKEVWLPDWQSNSIKIYTYEGEFIRKILCEGLIHDKFLIKDNRVFYANSNFYWGSHTNELTCADIQTGKLYSKLKSTIPNDLKINILLDPQLLYTYKDEVYYKNPLKDVVCSVDASGKNIKLTPKYKLNIGERDHKRRDDYFKPQRNLRYVTVYEIHESDNFILIASGYKDKSYRTVCSKKDWKCRNIEFDEGFINDMDPGNKYFQYRSGTSMSQKHLVMVIPDEIGDDNPAITVVELK